MGNIKKCKCGEPLERCESCGELMCVVCGEVRMAESGEWLCEDCYQEEITTLIESDTVKAELIATCPHPKTDDKESFYVITNIVLIAEQEAKERQKKKLLELKDRFCNLSIDVTHTKELLHFDYIKKCFIRELNQYINDTNNDK